MRALASAMLAATVLSNPTRAAAAASCSGPEGPPGGTYEVNVCFLTPTNLSPPIAGDVTVQAEVKVTGTGSPGIDSVLFRIRSADQLTGRGVYLITDMSGEGPPDDQIFEFTLPSYRWSDGDRRLLAKAQMADGYTTVASASIGVTFQNAGADPWPSHRFQPYVPNPQPTPLTVAAVGDGAIGNQTAAVVSNEIKAINPDMFLYLADVYQVGSLTEYYNWYGPTPGNTISCPGARGCGDYGQFYSITNPAQGVHEYNSPPIPGGNEQEAAGYTDYWGMNDTNKHYYSYDASGWHFISLDSTDFFRATPGWTDQYDWLQSDLIANAATHCTIAYWHHPYWGMKTHDEDGVPIPGGVDVRLTDLYGLMYDYGVDILLTGHQHNFQRWMPLDPSGAVNDTYGITEIVNGAGGHLFGFFTRTDDRLAAGIDRSGDAFRNGQNVGPSPNGSPAGVTKLELHPGHADYSFVLAGGPAKGQAFDSATIPCHDGPTDKTPPEAPSGAPTVTQAHAYTTRLHWDPSPSDDVAGYNVYRGTGVLTQNQCRNQCIQIGTTDASRPNGGLAFTDGSVAPSKTYTYAVRARDGSGNISGLSEPTTATTPAPLFADDFERGAFAPGWTEITRLAVQPDGEDGHVGDYDVRAVSTGANTNALKTFDAPVPDLYAQLQFKVLSQESPVTLLRLNGSSDTSLYRVSVTSKGRIRGRNEVAKESTRTHADVAPGSGWHRLTVHVHTDPSGLDHVDVWLDGTSLSQLSQDYDLDTDAIGAAQIGDNVSGRSYDVVLDDVKLDADKIAS
jgi:hypothetical protein